MSNHTAEELDALIKNTKVPEGFFGPDRHGDTGPLAAFSKTIKGAVRENRGCSLSTEQAREVLSCMSTFANIVEAMLVNPFAGFTPNKTIGNALDEADKGTYLMSQGIDVLGMPRDRAAKIAGV